jgi:hypothetical protein
MAARSPATPPSTFWYHPTRYAIVLLSNTAPSDSWNLADTAREVYNAAAIGQRLPPLLPRTRTTVPTASK